MGTLLAREPYRSRIPWDRVHVFWGDERWVPLASPESNAGEARRGFLDLVPLPPGNVHRWNTRAELPEDAAKAYESEIRRVFASPNGVPRFDLILLGMGDDGHTASLFPGSPGADLLRAAESYGYVADAALSPDGRTLVGRFNGNETFKSGSFEVRIISETPRIFFGKYFEDEGIVTDWCGVLGTTGPPTPDTGDIAAPVVRALPASGRAGTIVALRASARDNSGAAAALRLTVSRNGRTLRTLSLPARADGGIVTARWRAPKALRGELTFCATAVDAAGNESSRTCTMLRLR